MSNANRIEELRSKYEENPRRYFAPLANEFRKAGDLAQAIAICREHLPKQPGHMSGYIVFGQTLYEANSLDEARTVFEQALSLDPENLIALKHLGDIARMKGENTVARRWYERVLDADPRNEEMAAQLASLSMPTPPLAMPAVPAPVASPPPIDLDDPSGVFRSFDPGSLLDVPDDMIARDNVRTEWEPRPTASPRPTPTHEPIDLDFPDDAEPAPASALEEQFEEGLIAPQWPDTTELVARVTTPFRSATPLSVPVSADALDAFGREAHEMDDPSPASASDELALDNQLVEAYVPPIQSAHHEVETPAFLTAQPAGEPASAATIDAELDLAITAEFPVPVTVEADRSHEVAPQPFAWLDSDQAVEEPPHLDEPVAAPTGHDAHNDEHSTQLDDHRTQLHEASVAHDVNAETPDHVAVFNEPNAHNADASQHLVLDAPQQAPSASDELVGLHDEITAQQDRSNQSPEDFAIATGDAQSHGDLHDDAAVESSGRAHIADDEHAPGAPHTADDFDIEPLIGESVAPVHAEATRTVETFAEFVSEDTNASVPAEESFADINPETAEISEQPAALFAAEDEHENFEDSFQSFVAPPADAPADVTMETLATTRDDDGANADELVAAATAENVHAEEFDDLIENHASAPSVTPAHAESPAFVTETMAELLVSQGFVPRAIEIYEELVRRHAFDPVLSSRLAELRSEEFQQAQIERNAEQQLHAESDEEELLPQDTAYYATDAGHVQSTASAAPTPRFLTPIHSTPLYATPVSTTPASSSATDNAIGAVAAVDNAEVGAAPRRTARQQFAELAARRVSRRTPTHATAVADDSADGLSSLFGSTTPSTPDELAARALADAFGPVPDTGESLFDMPSTAAPAATLRSFTPLSNPSIHSSLTGDARSAATAKADYSFDRFFPDPVVAPNSGVNASTFPQSAPAAPAPASEDLAQFSAWLKGLNNA